MFKSYFEEKHAVEAKFEAQKIAFSPLTFFAVSAMLNLGFLSAVESFGESGATPHELAQKSGLNGYAVSLLSEMGLGMGIFKLANEESFALKLGKVGWFLLHDELTKVNFNFTKDVCFDGAKWLEKSLKEARPVGLEVFSKEWQTIYEGLNRLPQEAKKSWFEFDHFYSDSTFMAALPLVFAKPVRQIYDIGGNTAKFALAACAFDASVCVKIVDLASQTQVAEQNIKAAGLEGRVSTFTTNVLDPNLSLDGAPDVVWMSQFLDCFSLEQVTQISKKVRAVSDEATRVFVLEPLWDFQRYEAAAYSLQATSLYFTAMANGKSKMYRFGELVEAVGKGGFTLKTAHHNLGTNCYSLLEFAVC